MQVLVGEEAVAQHRVARDVREHAQLDLAVVGAEQLPPGSRDECLANLRAQRSTDGDILKIRVDRGEAPGRRDGLIEGGVQPPILPQRGGKRIEIRRFELHQLPVLEDLRRQGMLLRQLLQHFLVGRRACLPPLEDRQLQLLVEDLRQLLVRGGQELLAGHGGDLVQQLIDLHPEVTVQCLEPRDVQRDAGQLHSREHFLERQLQLGVELPQLRIAPQVLLERGGEAACALDERARGGADFVDGHFGERGRLLALAGLLAKLLEDGQLAGDALARRLRQ